MVVSGKMGKISNSSFNHKPSFLLLSAYDAQMFVCVPRHKRHPLCRI